MLTARQSDLLAFIDEFQGENSFSPSFDEMVDAMGLKSKSGIHRLLACLEERGHIHRLHHRARAIDILKLPGKVCPVCGQRSTVRLAA